MGANKSLRCDCGYVVVAETEHDLVAEIRRHARQAHGIVFSWEQALAVMLRSELDAHGQRGAA